MKGTEVPKPRHSSACDCTCVLTITVLWLSHACPCACLCKVCSRNSEALLQVLCNLSLAFLADFTLSDSTALIRFIAFSRKLHSAFRLDQKTWSQHSHVFHLTGTAALHCGHTFIGGILTANSQSSNSQWTSLPRTKRLLVTWSRFIYACAFSTE